MGRNPSDKPKVNHRKGLWSPEEDERLRSYILRHGHGCWSSIPTAAGLQRNGKSCRLRWINYLRPGLKRGVFTSDEEETILTLHRAFGNKWSQIANHLSGRTDNEIKNYWYSYLKKKVEAHIKEKSDEKVFSGCVTRVSSFESLVSKEGSSSSSSSSLQLLDQNVPKTNHQSSSLPRILFEEWLTMDTFNSPNHDLSFYSNLNQLTLIFSQSNTSNDGTSSIFSNSTYSTSGNYNLCDAYTKVGDETAGFDMSNHGEISMINEQIHDNVGMVDLLHGEGMCSEYCMHVFGNLI